MKKIIVLLFILACYWEETFGQNPVRSTFKKNTIYIELGGKGPNYSLNYDRIFYAGNRLAASYRVGFSVMTDAVSLPLALNIITGKQQHHAEFSLGLTPYVDRYKSFLSQTDLSDKYLYITSGIGYRYQKPTGGLYFTLGATPYIFLDPPSHNIFDVDPEFKLSGHLAVGYSF